MIKSISVMILAGILSGCSGSDNSSSNASSTSGFPPLPTSSSETITLDGKMTFWMYEGDAGCYGSISDGLKEVNLWIDATSCGERDYQENESASVDVTFSTENQYGPGKTYTIVSFN